MKTFSLFSLILSCFLLQACSSDSENPNPQAPNADIIDYSFGNQGLITTEGWHVDQSFADACLQTDGKMILVGTNNNYDYYSNLKTDFLAFRFDASGASDASFSGDGVVTTDISGSDARKGKAYGVSVGPDGKIIVVGTNDITQTATAKYNSDGSLDTSFGNNGIVLDSFDTVTNYSVGQSVVALADGKFVICGLSSKTSMGPGPWSSGNKPWGNGTLTLGLIKYNADGSRDTSFGSNGVVLQQLRPMLYVGYAFTYGYYLLDQWMHTKIVADDSGKLTVCTGIIAGQNNPFNDIDGNNVFRYDANGSLDLSFGTNGRKILDNTTYLSGRARMAFAAVPGNGYFFGGQNNTAYESSVFSLQKLSDNGLEDTSFNFSPFDPGIGPGYYGGVQSIALQSTGKIVVSGTYTNVSGITYLTLFRLNPNGSSDTSFANNGLFVKQLGQYGWGGRQKILIDAQDRIYLVFSQEYYMAVYRFNAN